MSVALHHNKRADAGKARVWSDRDRSAAGRHGVGVAVVVTAAPGLCRPVARSGPPQRTRAPGAVVSTHRCDLCRSYHLAARGCRRAPATATTATPGSGTRFHDRGSLGGGLPRWGEWGLGLHPQVFSHIGLVNAAWAISEAEAARTAW